MVQAGTVALARTARATRIWSWVPGEADIRTSRSEIRSKAAPPRGGDSLAVHGGRDYPDRVAAVWGDVERGDEAVRREQIHDRGDLGRQPVAWELLDERAGVVKDRSAVVGLDAEHPVRVAANDHVCARVGAGRGRAGAGSRRARR